MTIFSRGKWRIILRPWQNFIYAVCTRGHFAFGTSIKLETFAPPSTSCSSEHHLREEDNWNEKHKKHQTLDSSNIEKGKNAFSLAGALDFKLGSMTVVVLSLLF